MRGKDWRVADPTTPARDVAENDETARSASFSFSKYLDAIPIPEFQVPRTLFSKVHLCSFRLTATLTLLRPMVRRHVRSDEGYFVEAISPDAAREEVVNVGALTVPEQSYFSSITLLLFV
jgi:hypothetical protein